MADIQSLFTQLVDQIRAECTAEIVARIGGTTPAAKRAKVQPSAKPARRGPADMEKMIGAIKAYITKNPASRTEEIGAGMGIDTSELKLPMKKMVEDRILVRRGMRRAAKYTVKG